LAKFKSALRIVALIGVAAVYIQTQKAFFPEWLWKYAWWRYLLIVIVVFAVYLVSRLSGKFLSGMTAALKESEEQMRLRLLLKAAIWPIRLLLATIAVYAAKSIIQLPAAVTRIADGRVIVIAVGAIYLLRAVSGKPMSTLLAGLGIGGLAIALASQDTLKNFFGSIVIMLDKPFRVGQRVVVEGNDGVVEEIGFRSTRVRTLTGHLVTVPNEKMASANIENIGHRPSIRRLSNITITYDTPLQKVEKAVNIIRNILDNHEGMHPDFPPRVYFNEFNDASLNILMIYWYHPPDYWAFVAFSERVNLQIMHEFEKEGIEFAFPTTTTYLAHDERRPLSISLSSGAPLPGQRDSRE
jgi:small-conductance mechanosensitive channel